MFYLSKSKQNQNCDQFFLNISMTSFNKMYFFHGCIWKHITFLYETILWPPSYGPLINRYDPPRAPTTPTYWFPAPFVNKMSSSRSLRRCGPSSSATRRGWFPSGNKRSLNFLKAVFLPIFWRKTGAPLETKGSSIFLSNTVSWIFSFFCNILNRHTHHLIQPHLTERISAGWKIFYSWILILFLSTLTVWQCCCQVGCLIARGNVCLVDNKAIMYMVIKSMLIHLVC